MSDQIKPCVDADELRAYIHEHWRANHVLAVDDAMFRFTYMTPWVDRTIFPEGISVLGLYSRGRMTGFLGAIVAPYPRPQSYWLALWHVLPELKGTGMGGRLLGRMQEIAESCDGWIGTFGAGPEALPVYLKRGYAVRAGRRWIYDGESTPRVQSNDQSAAATASAERPPSQEWLDYRYRRHPVFSYAFHGESVFRTERNAWGVVTHVARLGCDGVAQAHDVFTTQSAEAAALGQRYLMDAWSFDCPGPGWSLAPHELPSVFHPPAARGNITYAVGRPFLPGCIHKGDCDQDRPNIAADSALTAAH